MLVYRTPWLWPGLRLAMLVILRLNAGRASWEEVSPKPNLIDGLPDWSPLSETFNSGHESFKTRTELGSKTACAYK